MDAAGALVADADLTLESSATGYKRTVRSNGAGVYQLPALPIGVYDLTIAKSGFRSVKVDDIRLSVGQVRTLDVKLEVAQVATSIDVSADATPIDQSTSEIGSAIGEQQLKNIPVNGRNWSSLMLLAPGATNTGDGTQNSIRFFGQSRDSNNWTFDGTDASGVKDPRQEGALRLVISLDSIAEFRVSSAMYTAETGGGGGAQVNLVSKSGTNEFHGSTFWFVRNDVFDARRVFDGATVPPFRMNQFGANLGGPIVKNKLFFYTNYEGLTQRLNVTSVNGLVPSAAFRQAVIAQTPALRPIMEAYPAGNAGSVNANVDRFTGVPQQKWDENSGMVRIDYRINDKHTLFGRFNTVQGVIVEPRTALLETRDSDVRPTQGTISLQSVFGSRTVNELKLGGNRSALERTTFGRLRERVDIPGFTSTQAFQFLQEKPTAYTVQNNFSQIIGRHTLKVGGEYRRVIVNVADTGGTRLTYGSVANFQANRLDRFEQSANYPMLSARRHFWNLYAQDEFKVKQNLTLNLGLRYEYFGVASEQYGRGRVLDFERCQGFCPAGSEWFFPDRNNFSPRVSLAWAPTAFKGKTVLRAGSGIFYSPGQNDDVNAALDSWAESLSLTNVDAPALSFPIASFLPLARAVGVTPRAQQRDRRDAYTTNWTFTLQQELPWKFVGQIGYVGNKGTNLFGRDRLNLINPATGRRPFSTFGAIDRKVNYNHSTFHGLQASVNRSFTRNWLMQFQYLYGKVIDNSAGAGDGQEVMISSCRACDRGPADFDIQQTATLNTVYDLPWAKNKLWGGWSVSGFFFARTGRAVNVTVDRPAAAIPDGNNAIPQRPDFVAGANPIPATQIADRWLNPGAFRLPAPGTWGNLGRNAFRGPGLWQVDTAITKRTRIAEGVTLEFRAEAFNLFNRAQIGNPAGNISNANFGRVLTTANDGATGQGTSRQLQFALRLLF